MKTIADIRRENLQALITQHGSVAELNERLGWARTDPRLTRVRNAMTRSDRGKPFQMGDNMAREIEAALTLESGWMDNVHRRTPALAVVTGDEPAAPYIEHTPSTSGQQAPAAGRDWRTVAYSLAASLERSKRQTDIKTFLAMVEGAYEVLTRSPDNSN